MALANGKANVENNAKAIFVIETDFSIVAGDDFNIRIQAKGTLRNVVYWDPLNGADSQPQDLGAESYPVKTLAKALEICENNSIIYLMNPLTIKTDTVLTATNVVIVRYNEHAGVLISVENNATLTLKDIIISGGLYDAESALINVLNGSKLIIEAGTTLKNNNYNTKPRNVLPGGAIYNEGTVVMNGGEITNNMLVNGVDYGGAIYSLGKVDIYGGLIYKNQAYVAGGAIYIKEGELNIYGGDIYNNTFDTNSNKGQGGAIYAASGTTVNIYGGNIVNNNAKEGGAIYSAGTTTISKGLIYGNTSTEMGGAIVSSGTLKIVDGEIVANTSKLGGAIYLTSGSLDITKLVIIYENTATQDGGAIYNLGATLVIGGGEIYENTANGNGGAIYLATGSTFTLNAGEIYANEAGFGGAIYAQTTGTMKKSSLDGLVDGAAVVSDMFNRINTSSFTIVGGYIYSNKTVETGNGGAIYLNDTTTITSTLLITGGEITENNAGSNGGAIYVNGNGFVEINGNVKISGNRAKANNAGAIYLNGANLLLLNGEITENSSLGKAAAILAAKNIDTNAYSTVVVLGGKITKNDNETSTTGAVHIESGSDLFVGNEVYIYENIGNNVFLGENTPVYALNTLSDSSLIGVENNSTLSTVVVSPYKAFELTNNKIIDCFVADNPAKRIFLKNNFLYLGLNELKGVVYVASDYIGDYDGASHSIGFEVISNPNNATIEFCAVQSIDYPTTNWSTTKPSFREGGKYYVYFRITYNGSNERDYRTVYIRNIVPEITEAPYINAKPSVNTVYSKTAGQGNSDNRPALLGGKASYNGRTVEGVFKWTYDEFSFTNVGLQEAFVTFDPHADAYSNIDFTIQVQVYTTELYYATSGEGVTGFYLNSTYTQPSDATTMQAAINSVANRGFIYIATTYNLTNTEYLTTSDTITIQRLSGFTGALFNVRNTADLVIGADSDGNKMTGTINIDGGAVWKASNGANSTPNADNYARNDGLVANDSLILVEKGAKLYLYAKTALQNNELYQDGKSGGAIYCLGEIYVDGATISRNLAPHGGAISLIGEASMIVEDGVISNNGTYAANKFTGYNGGNGGAIYLNNNELGVTALLIKKGSIDNNKATNNGGAIYNRGGKVELAPVKEGEGVSLIEIFYNATINDGTIYVSNEYKSELIIEGCEIRNNDAAKGDAIWYASYQGSKTLIIKPSSVGAEAYISGQIFLEQSSVIVQQAALDDRTEIEIDTEDEYNISRVVVEKVNFFDDVTNFYFLADESEGFYLVEIKTHGGNQTLQMGNTFTLYVSYQYESATIYEIEVRYGDKYEDYINGDVLKTDPETKMLNIGYEVYGYCYGSEEGKTTNIIDLEKQIYYNQDVSNNGYNLYTVWVVSTPIVTVASTSDDNEETYGTVITLSASIANKNETSDFRYIYQWFYQDQAIPGATSETYNVYEVDETGYYKVYVEVIVGITPRHKTSEKVVVTIIPAQIDVTLAVSEYTYTGTQINATFKNGIDGDVNIELVEGQLKYNDDYEDLDLRVQSGTEVAVNANTGTETYSMRMQITNTNYVLKDEHLLWKINPLTLEVDYWYDTTLKEQYIGAYEQGDTKHLIVPIFKNLYVDPEDGKEKIIVKVEFTDNNETTFQAFYYEFTDSYVESFVSNIPANPTGFDKTGSFKTTILDVSNTNYKLPDEVISFNWSITGTQAFIEKWQIEEQTIVHSSLADKDYTVDKNYTPTGYRITASMAGTNGVTISSNLKVVISVTGTTNSGTTYEEEVSYNTTTANNLVFTAGLNYITVTDAGVYTITISIIEFEEALNPTADQLALYYIKNADGTYTQTTQLGDDYSFDPSETYYNRVSSYYLSPTANYTITLNVNRDAVALTWGIDNEEKSSIVYTALFHDVSVISNDKNIALTLNYSGDFNKKDAGEYTVVATLSTQLSYNYVIAEGTETFVWTIEKAPLTIEWPENATYEWNSKMQTFVPLIKGTLGSDNLGITFTGHEQREIASYECKIVTTTLNANYTLGEQTLVQVWEIIPRILTFKWLIEDDGFDIDYATPNGTAVVASSVYDGAQYILRAHIANLVNNYTEVNFTPTYVGDDPNCINAGVYNGVIDISLGLSGTHKSYYQLVANNTTTVAWRIDPREVTFVWDYTQPYTYDSNEHEVKASVNPNSIVRAGDEFVIYYSNDFIDDNTRYQQKATAVGKYIAKVRDLGNSNYTFVDSNSTVKLNWEIVKRKITFVWKATGFETPYYTGASKYYFIEDMNGLLDSERGGVTHEVVYTNSSNRQFAPEYILDVDTYTATASISGQFSNNYVIDEESATYTWQILPRALNFTWTGTDYYEWTDSTIRADVISDRAQYFTVAPNNAISRDTIAFEVSVIARGIAQTLSVAFDKGSMILTDYVSFMEANSKDSGSYTATITGLGGTNNYTLTGAQNITQSWTITPAKLDLSTLSNILTLDYNGLATPFVYNAQPQTVVVNVRDTYKTDNYLTLGLHYSVSGVTQTNAGTYVATVSLVKTGNYIFTNGTLDSYDWSIDWQITRLYAELSWTYEDDSFTGSNKFISAVVTNVQGSDSVNVIGYSTEEIPGIHNYSSPNYTNVAVNVGTYLAKASELSNVNYMLDENTSTCEWVITPRKASISWAGTNISGDSATYNKNVIYYSATVANLINATSINLVHTYSYSADGIVWNVLANGSSDCTQAGFYKCELSISGESDYQLKNDIEKTWEIKKKTLTFVWNFSDTTYDGRTHNPTISTISGRIPGDNVNQGEYGGDVNKVAVTPTGEKYTTTMTSLSGTDSANYTLEGSVNISWEWTISPVKIAFEWRANTATWVYDRTAKYYQPSVTEGLVDSQTLSFNVEIKFTNPDGVTQTLTDFSNCSSAGSYTATIVALAGDYKDNYSLANYATSYLTKTWKVEQKQVTFSWDYSGSIQYSGEQQSVFANVVGVLAGDQVTVAATGGYENNAKINVGKYTARIVKLSNLNYSFNAADEDSFTTLDWEITPLTITINWIPDNIDGGDGVSEVRKTYDATSSSFIPEIGNKITGEAVNISFSTTLNGTFTNETVNAGAYVRTVMGLSGAHSVNYVLPEANKLSKTWYVDKVNITFSNGPAVEYNASSQSLNVILNGVLPADVLSVYPLYDGEMTFLKTNAGTYTPEITIGGAKAVNYVLVYQDGEKKASLTINTVELVLTSWKTATYYYNGKNQYPTAEISNIKGNDSPVEYTYQYTKSGGTYVDYAGLTSEAGSYRIKAELKGKGFENYTLIGETYKDYEIKATALKSYTVVALQTGSASAVDEIDKQTIVLIVVYGSDNPEAKFPTGTVTIDYKTGISAGASHEETVALSQNSPATAFSDIYEKYQAVIDLYLTGNYSYSIATYTESNENPYKPGLSYVCAINNEELEAKNYQDFSLGEISQTFYPSNLPQNPLNFYFSSNGSYTEVTAGATATYTYGDRVNFFITGGTDLVNQDNKAVKDNNYMLIVNSVFANVSGDFAQVRVNYITDINDTDIQNFKAAFPTVWKTSVVKAEVQFISAGKVVMGSYKTAGADENTQTYIEVFSNSITIDVKKKEISIVVPDATMIYGTGVLTKNEGSDFEFDNDELVNPSVDLVEIPTYLELICNRSDYLKLGAGVYNGAVSVEFTHPNYTLKSGGITYGDLTISGQVLTNDTEGVSIVLDDSGCVYNGSIQIPSITTVSYGATTLTYDSSKIVYDNAIQAGENTARLTLTLTGNYRGTLIAYYSIAKLDIKNAIFDPYLTADEVYTTTSITKNFINGETSYVTVNRNNPTPLILNTDFEVFYSNNINVSSPTAKATITIAGKGNNVGGGHTLYFNIVPQTVATADISDYTLKFNNVASKEYTFTGEAITPTVTYLYSDTKGVAFNVSDVYVYLNSSKLEVDGGPINVGIYYVVATIQGAANSLYVNYVGTVELEYKITQLNFSNDDLFVIGAISDQVYQVGAITPTIEFFWNKDGDGEFKDEELLTLTTDYTVEYGNNIQTGIATVTVTGANNFSGTKTTTFNIVQRDISALNIFRVNGTYNYTGRQIAPTAADISGEYVFDESNKEDVTFAIKSYGDNVDAGTLAGSVTITGTGNYKGDKLITFDISRLALSDSLLGRMEIVLDYSQYVYTGTAIEPDVVSISYKVTEATPPYTLYLKKGFDYNITNYIDNVNAGQGTIEITFSNAGNFSGTIHKTFIINPKVLDTNYFITTIDHTDLTSAPNKTISEEEYTAQNITKEIYVFAFTEENGTYTYTELKENTDYKLSFINNKNVGTAYIEATGINNYTSKISNRFAITAKDIAEINVSDIVAQTYTSMIIIPNVVLTFGSETLTLNKDYTVSVTPNADNINAGTGSITISGMGNYKGSVEREFVINPKNLEQVNVNISEIAQQEYTGEEIKPDAGVVITDGTYILVLTKDYDIEYSSNTNVGSRATITITGKGNYVGTVYKQFEIIARDISKHSDEFEFTLLGIKYFTGSQITLTLSDFEVTYLGEKLAQDGTAYSINESSYANNINAGQASFAINGNGNFTGSLVFEYTITPLPYGEQGTWSIALDDLFRYTDKEITPKPIIKANLATLVEGTDYTLVYKNHKGITHTYDESSGTWVRDVEEDSLPTIYIQFIGNYSGSTQETFGIAKINITADDIVVTMKKDIFYNGSQQKLTLDDVEIVLKASNGSEAYMFNISDLVINASPLTSNGSDTNNQDVGTAAIQIVFGGANGVYSGSVVYDYEIKQLNIASNLVVIDESLLTSVVYTGFAQTKDFEGKIVVGSTTLVLDEDFSISYKNNTNVGDAEITLTGLKNLVGTKTITFKITPKTFNGDEFTIESIADQIYNYGSEIKIDELVKVKFTKAVDDIVDLTATTDFYIGGYENNINKGEATVIVRGYGNFDGELKQTFNILARQITNADIKFVNDEDKVYTGDAIKLNEFYVNISDRENIKIVDANEANSVIYTNNTNKGVATVTFNVDGNYQGVDLSLQFDITARQYDSSRFKIPNIRTQVKTGSEIRPVFAEPYTTGPIIFTNENGNEKVLVQGTDADYTLTYSNNIEYGMAYIYITFRGNYSSSAVKSFKIDKATPTMEEFNAIKFNVVDKNATSVVNAKYGQVKTLADLKFVDDEMNVISTIRWANENISIENAGKVSAYVNYNPDEVLFNTLSVLISFNIDKGTYDADAVKGKIGEYIEFKFIAGLKLSSIELPEYFTWQYQLDSTVTSSTSGTYYIINASGEYEPKYLPTDYQSGTDYYLKDVDLSLINIGNLEYYSVVYKASYNENENCYETLKDIDVTIRILRGDLKPSNFEHTPITVTYNKNLTVGSIGIMTAGYSWDETQEGFDRLLVANGDEGEIFYMNYNPKFDTKFVESVFGNKNNYNAMKVQVRVYVLKANYTKNEVLRALGNFVVSPKAYKPGLTIADLNISLPEGFTFANTASLLSYGVNDCSIIYNYESAFNANYNSYGESLTEKLTIPINITTPMLKGTLDTTNENVVESEVNGIAIKGVWNERLDKNGTTVPYILEYYDEVAGVWSKVTGTASWLNGEEVLTVVGYITRQIKFVADDKNFTEGRDFGIFDVKVLISGAYSDTESLKFINDEITYSNNPTLKNITRVTSPNAALQYLDDVRYMYKQVHRLGDGTYLDPEFTELTADTILDAGEYEITAFFDSGKCVYYSFPEGYTKAKTLIINKAVLNISINSVIRTYGDLIINNDSAVRAEGIEGLSEDDYTLAVYSDENMINKVNLSYLTNAGTYYIILELDEDLKTNYDFGENLIFKNTYTIKQREIKDYEIVLSGVLREDGTKLNDKISVIFDESQFVDGIIPEYELIFTKEGVNITNVISEGDYRVTIVFANSNYYTNRVSSFKVYEPQTYTNLIIIVAVIVVAVLGVIIVIAAVRANRKKNNKNIQKEQYKRTQNEMNSNAQQNLNNQVNNQNYDPNQMNNGQYYNQNQMNNGQYYDPNMNNQNYYNQNVNGNNMNGQNYNQNQQNNNQNNNNNPNGQR